MSETDTVKELADGLASHEHQLAASELEFSRAESRVRAWRAWTMERDERLAEFGIPVDTDQSEAHAMLEGRGLELSKRIEALTVLFGEGEVLALDLTRISEGARRIDIEADVAELRREVSELDLRYQARNRTGELATRMIEGLRDAGSEVVERELKRMEPLLQRLYARVDPHVALRDVRFLTKYARGHGRLQTRLLDDVEDLSTDVPEIVLSSSQMNALAVSVFLSFNLGLSSLPLEVAILDDPF